MSTSASNLISKERRRHEMRRNFGPANCANAKPTSNSLQHSNEDGETQNRLEYRIFKGNTRHHDTIFPRQSAIDVPPPKKVKDTFNAINNKVPSIGTYRR